MASKIDWADDAAAGDDFQRTETDYDENGIKTVVEYRMDEQGRRVKVTRKIKRTLIKTEASAAVAQRHKWTKFGAEKNKKAGPDSATTSLGSENVRIKLSVGNKDQEQKEDEKALKAKAELGGGKKVSCRLCQGDHFTARCPYKDTLGDIDDAAPPEDGAEGSGAGGMTIGGKYVPPSLRSGARGAGETMGGRGGRDDYPTLRVTNLSEETEEEDLWGIFNQFGRVHRIFMGRDQVTGECKGFAFVSYESRHDAEAAIKRVHGMPFAHLILSCQWSVPKEKL